MYISFKIMKCCVWSRYVYIKTK